MDIHERVFSDWDRNEGDVYVEFRSPVRAPDPVDLLRVAVERVTTRCIEVGDYVEVWDAVPTPKGAAVLLSCDELRPFVEGVATELDALDAVGVLDSLDSGGGPEWRRPTAVRGLDVFEAWLTLDAPVGAPEAAGGSSALHQQMIQWCLATKGGLYVSIDATGFPVQPEEVLDVFQRASENRAIALRGGSDDDIRNAEVSTYHGRHALFQCGRTGIAPAWDEAVRHLRKVLLRCAAWPVVYGFVKRTQGQAAIAGDYGSCLRQNWVDMPHVPADVLPIYQLEFTHVPDAFGMQLLGPGHPRLTLDQESWVTTDLSDGFRLVEHHDLRAWYASPQPEAPTVESARTDFAQLLMNGP